MSNRPALVTQASVVVNATNITRAEACERLALSSDQFLALVDEGIFPRCTLIERGRALWNRKMLYAAADAATIKAPTRVDPGFVYFMQMGDFIKIGFSAWPATRRDNLQAATPYEIAILLKAIGSKDEEAATHKLFAKTRERREWFRRTAGLLAFIEWHKIMGLAR